MIIIMGLLAFLPSKFGMFFFAVNVIYSLGLKKAPYLEILIVASGFVFRIYAGGELVDVPISKWLVMLIASTALLIICAKRKTELELSNAVEVRSVLKYYSLKGFKIICLSASLPKRIPSVTNCCN
jgi:decaprenyl-phosphate phosphoribosyltransferase